MNPGIPAAPVATDHKEEPECEPESQQDAESDECPILVPCPKASPQRLPEPLPEDRTHPHRSQRNGDDERIRNRLVTVRRGLSWLSAPARIRRRDRVK
jgi:hypothetical protein